MPGLNKAALQFVHKNLMIEKNDDEAREAFTKYNYVNSMKTNLKAVLTILSLILQSSNTLFSTINFAIHTLAQPTTNKSKDFITFVRNKYKYVISNFIFAVIVPKIQELSFLFSQVFSKFWKTENSI